MDGVLCALEPQSNQLAISPLTCFSPLTRLLVCRRSWMANVGVNVPVPEVISYMGSLYAENIVLGEWMFDVDKVGSGLSRAWIYQEMSFGPLDEEAMGGLFDQLRERGRAMSEIPKVKHPDYFEAPDVLRNEPEDVALVKAYVQACGYVASLLQRRAFGVIVKAGLCRWFEDIERLHFQYSTLERLGVRTTDAHTIYDEVKSKLPGIRRPYCTVTITLDD